MRICIHGVGHVYIRIYLLCCFRIFVHILIRVFTIVATLRCSLCALVSAAVVYDVHNMRHRDATHGTSGARHQYIETEREKERGHIARSVEHSLPVCGRRVSEKELTSPVRCGPIE